MDPEIGGAAVRSKSRARRRLMPTQAKMRSTNRRLRAGWHGGVGETGQHGVEGARRLRSTFPTEMKDVARKVARFITV